MDHFERIEKSFENAHLEDPVQRSVLSYMHPISRSLTHSFWIFFGKYIESMSNKDRYRAIILSMIFRDRSWIKLDEEELVMKFMEHIEFQHVSSEQVQA